MGKLLGLDFGTKRIGYAVSDESQIVVFPRGAIAALPRLRMQEALKKIIKEEGIIRIVIGLPLDEDNNETRISMGARRMGEELRAASGLEVIYIDEFNTTAEAISKIPFKKYKDADKDAVSAQLILERYITQRTYQAPSAEV